jgi:hypothetical protein
LLPAAIDLDQGVCGDDEFSHDGGDGDFGGFSGGDELLVLCFEVGIEAGGDERRRGTADDYAFPSRVDQASHLSTRQYARLVDEWVEAVGLRRAEYGTHSLRRAKASMIYKATGNLRAIQILLDHTKIDCSIPRRRH